MKYFAISILMGLSNVKALKLAHPGSLDLTQIGVRFMEDNDEILMKSN